MRIDLHTHTTMSDGTDSPDELLAKARSVGLDAIAVTDHDTMAGLPAVRAAARREGIELLEGMEMSCALDRRSVHLLAYAMNPDDQPLAEELARIRTGRGERLPRILARLEELGVPVTTAEVLAQVGEAPSIGRPHVADAMVAHGYVRDRSEAFERYLAEGRPAYVRRYEPDLRRGIGLVHAAGGLAVIAHPWGRESAEVLIPEVLADLVAGSGLDGFEVDHADHGPPGSPQRAELAELAADLGVLGTGSSDYHGTGKPNLQLGCNLTAPEVYAELRRRLG